MLDGLGEMGPSQLVTLSAFLFVALSTSAQAGPPPSAASTVGKVYFKIECSVSHRNNDDPILFPRQPGRSHSHDYFGSKIVDAYTARTSQLQEGGTSCNPPGATAGYWIPTLSLLNNATNKYKPSPPRVITVYYFNRYHGNLTETVEAVPEGLKLICGNGRARGPGDLNPYAVQWFCGEDPFGAKYANFPKKCKWFVMARVYCPSCWDGRLTSADFKSHLAYVDPISAECPSSHPRRLPEIHATFTYNFFGTNWPRRGIKNKRNPPFAKLSTKSGAGWQFHMDVWEAWDRATLKDRMENCFYARLQCTPDGKFHDRPIIH